MISLNKSLLNQLINYNLDLKLIMKLQTLLVYAICVMILISSSDSYVQAKKLESPKVKASALNSLGYTFTRYATLPIVILGCDYVVAKFVTDSDIKTNCRFGAKREI